VGQSVDLGSGWTGMGSDDFVKVFDILDTGFRNWTFSAFGLIFIAFGIVILAFPRFLKAVGIPYLNLESRSRRYFPLGIAIVWTILSFLNYPEYLHHRSMAQENRCRVVEGPVEHFVLIANGRLTQETFYVSGVRFSYSDFAITDGFNTTSSHGGPINASSYVRICYDPAGNVILRLEIRDFKGELKDYGKPWSNRPRENERSPAIKLPWDANLFVWVFLFDFVAIVAMFPPYIRTFFRIESAAVSDCRVPAGLEPDKKTKLRNTMIYWDRTERVIWLRPRGYNLLQVPSLAAMLRIDERGTSILESEIRLSPAVPVAMVLVVWGFYRALSTLKPINGLSPMLLAGIAAPLLLIGSILGLQRFRSRMTPLINDALSELRQMRGPWG
jgi:hypothetical protein